jgi:1-acyl-sn-glycerol-3-phosphate acyltransferase
VALLKTVLIFLVLGIALILFIPAGIIAVIFSYLGLRKLMTFLTYNLARVWALMLIMLTGCKVTVIGREYVPPKGGVCFVSNHSGIFDILLHLAYIGRPIGFIAKKELILIPLLNLWIFLLDGLFIDRKNVRKSIRTINAGIKKIKDGGAMVIFPEGHRSKGRGLLPFHSGSFRLAVRSEAPIIPVALEGSYDVFERSHRINAVPVRIIFGKPIDTASLPAPDRKQMLADQVYAVIKQALESGRP